MRARERGLEDGVGAPLSLNPSFRFAISHAKPRQAIGMASAKWMGTGASTGKGFVADQQRNHPEADGAGEPRKFAELADAEREARIACESLK